MFACNEPGCAGHDKKYNATIHRLYEQYYGRGAAVCQRQGDIFELPDLAT